ncbi:hypothetical protein ABLE68_07950 [Nocardioides sp. CN2-186]|uniref:hypothetical protein n=1 Tax=Nocardioides tweenelious TaxID=3156607 RepID=UPI0032B59F30
MALLPPEMPQRPPPGPAAGSLLGVPAGALVGAVWRYGASDVALAVTAVLVGLVGVLMASPGWRPFATGMGVVACVAVAAVFFI